MKNANVSELFLFRHNFLEQKVPVHLENSFVDSILMVVTTFLPVPPLRTKLQAFLSKYFPSSLWISFIYLLYFYSILRSILFDFSLFSVQSVIWFSSLGCEPEQNVKRKSWGSPNWQIKECQWLSCHFWCSCMQRETYLMTHSRWKFFFFALTEHFRHLQERPIISLDLTIFLWMTWCCPGA